MGRNRQRFSHTSPLLRIEVILQSRSFSSIFAFCVFSDGQFVSRCSVHSFFRLSGSLLFSISAIFLIRSSFPSFFPTLSFFLRSQASTTPESRISRRRYFGSRSFIRLPWNITIWRSCSQTFLFDDDHFFFCGVRSHDPLPKRLQFLQSNLRNTIGDDPIGQQPPPFSNHRRVPQTPVLPRSRPSHIFQRR